MNQLLNASCPKCGKQLDGIVLFYRHTWDCAACATDQTDVLHAERGCKVQFKHPDWGYECDPEHAAQYLSVGSIYTVERVEVGSSYSDIVLAEVPGQKFNTVQFERVK